MKFITIAKKKENWFFEIVDNNSNIPSKKARKGEFLEEPQVNTLLAVATIYANATKYNKAAAVEIPSITAYYLLSMTMFLLTVK